jgi:hypothetical protein
MYIKSFAQNLGRPVYRICILSFCCISESSRKTQSWCWLELKRYSYRHKICAIFKNLRSLLSTPKNQWIQKPTCWQHTVGWAPEVRTLHMDPMRTKWLEHSSQALVAWWSSLRTKYQINGQICLDSGSFHNLASCAEWTEDISICDDNKQKFLGQVIACQFCCNMYRVWINIWIHQHLKPHTATLLFYWTTCYRICDEMQKFPDPTISCQFVNTPN